MPNYSRSGAYLPILTGQMGENFYSYFKGHPAREMDWEWHDDNFHVAFAGGETATGPTPRVAVAKAALLCPYLWDETFDWKTLTRNDNVDRYFVTSLLGHLQPRK